MLNLKLYENCVLALNTEHNVKISSIKQPVECRIYLSLSAVL